MTRVRTVCRYLFYVFVALALTTTSMIACKDCYRWGADGKKIEEKSCLCPCLRHWIRQSDGKCIGGVDASGNLFKGCGHLVDLDYFDLTKSSSSYYREGDSS